MVELEILLPLLLYNVIFMLALISIYSLTIPLVRGFTPLWRGLSRGLMFGGIASLAMFNPVELAPGVLFDGRYVIILLAAVFEGGYTGLITVLFVALVRFVLGGEGVASGILTSLAAAGLGWYVHERWGRTIHERGPLFFLLLGPAVMIATGLVAALVLPSQVTREVALQATAASLLLYPPSTLLLGLLLAREIRRERTEQALKESETRLRTFMTSAPMPTVITRVRDGHIQFVNSEYLRLLKATTEAELLGRSAADFYADPQQRSEVLAALREQGQLRQHQLIYRALDGTTGWVLASIQPLEQGGEQMLIATLQDITERKLSEERFRLLAENVSDLFCLHERDGTYIYVSPSCREMLGYEPEELVGTTPLELFHPDDLEMVRAELRRTLDGEKAGATHRMRRKDGSYIWLETHSEPIFDPDGKVYRLVTSSRDITERKQTEDMLRDSEARQRALLAGIPDMLIRTDRMGHYLEIHPAPGFAPLWPVEEMVGRRMHEFLSAELADLALQNIEQALESGQMQSYEYRLEEARGLRDYEARLVPYGQREVLILVRDITDRKQAEERVGYLAGLLDQVSDAIISTDAGFHIRTWNPASEQIYGWKQDEVLGRQIEEIVKTRAIPPGALETLQTKGYWQGEVVQHHRSGHPLYIQSSVTRLDDNEGRMTGALAVNRDITELKEAREKLIALELEKSKVTLMQRFISSVSHDFRTPLAAINTGLYLLVKSPDEEKRARRVELIERQVQRLERLLDETLVMVRLDSVEEFRMYLHDLNVLVRNLATDMRSLAEKQGLLLEVKGGGVPPVCLNSGELYQALRRIVENAIDYTPEGGQITLHTFRWDQDAVVEVRDTGIGIPEDDLPHLFDRFYRVDKSRSSETGGAGLGLSIARRIVELHHGTLEAESVEGQGSTFRIRLPLRERC